MSVVPSTMKCPVCPEQTLEALTASIGTFERCPNCRGLFIQQDILAAASQDRTKCLEALEETKALLLPTDKWCPKCMQKLLEGRVRSRGVIVTLCSTCQSLWTNIPLLHQFDEVLERTLLLQIDIAMDSNSGAAVGGERVTLPSRSAAFEEPIQDTGLGHFFRAFARFFDRRADSFSGRTTLPYSRKTTKSAASAKPAKPGKKSVILDVEPAMPPSAPLQSPSVPKPEPNAAQRQAPVEMPAPSIEVPEFIFPEEPVSMFKPEAKREPIRVPEPKALHEPVLEPKPAVLPEPEPEAEREPEADRPAEPVALPIPEPEKSLEPLLQSGAEPTGLPAAEPMPLVEAKAEQEDQKARNEQAELRRLLSDAPPSVEKPPADVKKAAPPKDRVKPDVPSKTPPIPPLPKPVQDKPLVKEVKVNPGFFAKFKSAWSPAPKKTSKVIKSVEPAAPSAKPATAESYLPKAAPAPVSGEASIPIVKKPVSLPTPQPTPVAKPTPEPAPEAGLIPVVNKPVTLPEPQPTPVVKPAPFPEEAAKSAAAPISAPKAPPVPKPVKPPKIKGPGFLAKLFTPKPRATAKPKVPVPGTPAPEAAEQTIIRAENQPPLKEVPTPVETKPKPAAPVKKPAPVLQKALSTPKPKREKVPRDPMDHMAVWPPWALGLSAVVGSSFRDFGFEAGPAMLWGIAGWSCGYMVRLSRLYPLRPFQETTLQALVDMNPVLGTRVVPVILTGQIVPGDGLDPKGPVVFKQDDKTILLNRLGRWDLIPRFFGLSNPRQLITGDVVVKAWYRPGRIPFLEVQEVRAGKALRKSMVRSLRWAFAVTLFVLAIVVSLALE